ncbi:hypothetical protein ISN45_Aa07g038180 [Arabidopsis thaliana x Arabidopsis arenosa]|uniref:Uncharacterized protein n=1 Tax=Arabidopsis thaliana x Arabidopsis arenosa TaxID=1240361 RepID=A0A8T1YDH6_9BRAS|nr:hypothetical protein ISN45_Aa07g038180 [Arabidopsis thaliana x Arabidopsis arenosa]
MRFGSSRSVAALLLAVSVRRFFYGGGPAGLCFSVRRKEALLSSPPRLPLVFTLCLFSRPGLAVVCFPGFSACSGKLASGRLLDLPQATSTSSFSSPPKSKFCITWDVLSTKLSDEGGVDEQRTRFGKVLDELISRFVSVYWKQVTAGASSSRRCTNDMFYFNKVLSGLKYSLRPSILKERTVIGSKARNYNSIYMFFSYIAKGSDVSVDKYGSYPLVFGIDQPVPTFGSGPIFEDSDDE